MTQARRPPAPRSSGPTTPTRVDPPFVLQATVIFIVALAIRLVHVWQLRSSPFFTALMGDAHGYDEWARRIAGGEWIGSEVFYQAPLYPYFLGSIYATVGHSLLAVRLVQAVVGASSALLLGLAARRFFSPRVGVVAGLMLAVYAPAIFFDGLLQKSVLDGFLMTLSLWLIAGLVDAPGHRRAWFWLGLAMGGLSLTRENALVFVGVVLAWAVLRRPVGPSRTRRLERAGAFVLGLALVLLPVAVRNYAVGGGFYLTTSQFGPNLFIGNNPKADGTYMALRVGRGAPEFERRDATELAEHALGRSLTPAQVSSYWTDRALDFITAQPGAWMQLMGRKFLLLWNRTEMIDTEGQDSHAEWSLPLRVGGWFGHFGLLVPLALAGALLAWRERQRLAVLYAMTVVYAASVLLFYVFARYRLPLVPLLIPFAAFAIVTLPTIARAVFRAAPDARPSLSRRSAISATALVALVTVFTNWPVLSTQLMKAITETNLGSALQEEGRLEEAVDHFRRAIALRPGYAPAYNNLGVTLRAKGDLDEAIRSYEEALALGGDFPDAHYNMANALLEQNRAGEAADHFRIALESIPDSAGTRNNLGIALAAQGKPDEAAAAFRSAVEAEPMSAVARRNLGNVLSTLGRTNEAIEELKRAAQLDPTDAVAYYDLGTALIEASRLDEAVTALRAALQIDPRSADAHNNLGIALATQGHIDLAIEEFRRAVALDPGFPDAQRNLSLLVAARNERPATPR